MTLKEYNSIKPLKQNPEFCFSAKVDKKKLIKLHYKCYYDDEEYMLNDWDRIINFYFNKKLTKIKFVCRMQNDVIGACIGWIKHDNKFLFSICVDPDYRGKGIAKLMLDRFLQNPPQLSSYLTVFEDNTNAIALYKKFGYKIRKITNLFCTQLKLKFCFHC